MEKSVGLISLGCAKNLVDSEIMLGFVERAGFRIVVDPEAADVLVVNTCGFIGPAKEESISTILEMAELKKKGRCRALVVTGCLSGRYKEELLASIPEIDGLLGTTEMNQIGEVVDLILAGERVIRTGSAFDYDDPDMPRVLASGSHMAYLKIAEGCGHQCAFCVIPQIRGTYRSRRPEAVLREAEALVAQGIKELVVIAQDTTGYGKDLGGISLAGLLKEIAQLPVPWIRVLYTYPSSIDDSYIETVAEYENVLPYIDLPLQHASDSVLRRMLRPGSYSTQLQLIKRLRSSIPQAFLRSSFIVGFPGETQSEFEDLKAFLGEAQLQHAGIFKFSPEEDTRAFAMTGQVDNELKERRYEEAMQIQKDISLLHNNRLVGQTLQVLVDGPAAESDLVVCGRHRGQAPEVDGVVYLGRPDLRQGDMVSAIIKEAHPYDLVGEVEEGTH